MAMPSCTARKPRDAIVTSEVRSVQTILGPIYIYPALIRRKLAPRSYQAADQIRFG